MIKIVKSGTEEEKEYFKALRSSEESERFDVMKTVDAILKDIKNNGDEALLSYTRKFDFKDMKKESLKVTKTEIEEAYKNADEAFIKAAKKAHDNITEFHEKQKANSWLMTKDNGVLMGQKLRGLNTVGLYVPGGTAAYPSSVLMNAIPAKVAGVKRLVMITPPSKEDGTINPYVLAAADIAGVDEIYKAGGAQAIGALAYGTETIPKVDKIVGPGNIFVAMAKRSVYGFVDIDMIAGPSEILVVADESADPSYLAADLMSQAEHDKLASSVLVTPSLKLAEKVNCEIEKQIKTLSRKEIIEASLKNHGAIVIVKDLDEAVKIANDIAPEHIELCVEKPFEMLPDIENAGSIFLGNYSPEPLGDYMAGPNHILPTSGTARFFSPLSVDDFVKKSSFIYYTKKALSNVNNDIVKLAETEGLTAHANSIKVRFKEN